MNTMFFSSVRMILLECHESPAELLAQIQIEEMTAKLGKGIGPYPSLMVGNAQELPNWRCELGDMAI